MSGGSTYVIAEIGVNHDGSVDKALELVEAVATTGADAVKIQTFTAASLVSADAPKAAYQLVTTPAAESQLEMLRRLELSRDDHRVILMPPGRTASTSSARRTTAPAWRFWSTTSASTR